MKRKAVAGVFVHHDRPKKNSSRHRPARKSNKKKKLMKAEERKGKHRWWMSYKKKKTGKRGRKQAHKSVAKLPNERSASAPSGLTSLRHASFAGTVWWRFKGAGKRREKLHR
jgi:hypothetical protein